MPPSHIPPSHYNVILKGRVMFHIINDEFIRGVNLHAPKPKDIPIEEPKIRKPPFPTTTQSSLRSMKPGVFFVDFDCDKHCRSLGICVHYQFVVGSKKCPDGLICQACRQSAEQVAIRAARKCPLHFRPGELKPIGSRAEDFSATIPQQAACAEILRRSFENDWADLNIKSDNKKRRNSILSEAENSRAHQRSKLDPVDHTERETTPRTIHDVRQMEAARKLSEEGAFDSGYSSWHSSFSENDPNFVSLQNSLLNQRTGVSFEEFQAQHTRETASVADEPAGFSTGWGGHC